MKPLINFKTPAKRAKDKSTSALTMFSEAISELRGSNKEAEELVIANEVKITALETENAEMDVLLNSNSKIIDNISVLIVGTDPDDTDTNTSQNNE